MHSDTPPTARTLVAVAAVAAALLMTELALTRIFSVVMYYHFAFLAISIALFGLSASGVAAYLGRARLDRIQTNTLLARTSLIFAVCTIVALFALVRLRVGLTYSPRNLALMLTIYGTAALPFFTGGLVITLSIARFAAGINAVYAADLIGAAAGCLVLIPLLDRVGAPGVVLTAALLASVASILYAPPPRRLRTSGLGALVLLVPVVGQLSGVATFDVTDTKGHEGDRVLFSKWNSFSRIGVYERAHGDWSLSPAYKGPLPDTRFMDIDSAASTPILKIDDDLSNAQYLRYELTALPYHLKEQGLGTRDWGLDGSESTSGPESRGGADAKSGAGFKALVIGPGGGRDLASALVFGAEAVDAVEINPIIANEVMRGRFREFSGAIYDHPRVNVVIDDGRSFVRQTAEHYDVIQASLVDTWAATAAGAYTLTENTLYTVEAFENYLDRLNEGGVLAITRWVFDGLRLVSLAQAACEARGWDAASRLVIVQHDRVATFLLKRSAFTPEELETLHGVSAKLGFTVLYSPRATGGNNDYARLITATDRQAFHEAYDQDIRPTTDDRPFFFHTTKLEDQLEVAFGRSMLFGNGLSALLTLIGISMLLVASFVVLPLVFARGDRPRRWPAWLVYFGALGAGFMLIEVSLLQRFVLLLGHPVYSLTITLFSLLLGTGLGAALGRKLSGPRLGTTTVISLLFISVTSLGWMTLVTALIDWAILFPREARVAVAIVTLVPVGMLLGVPMPAGIQLLSRRAPEMLTWAWGMNGALSVVGATLAIFIAMNWGFQMTLVAASASYLAGLVALVTTGALRRS